MLEHFVLAIVYASQHRNKETLEVYITVTWCRVFAWAVQHASFWQGFIDIIHVHSSELRQWSVSPSDMTESYFRLVVIIIWFLSEWYELNIFISVLHWFLSSEHRTILGQIQLMPAIRYRETKIWVASVFEIDRKIQRKADFYTYVCFMWEYMVRPCLYHLRHILCMELAYSKYSTCAISCLHSIDKFFNIELKECPLPVSRLKFCQMFCSECIFRYHLTQDVQKITSRSSVSHISLCEQNWLSLHSHVCMKYQLSSLNMTDNFPCINSQMSSTPYKRFSRQIKFSCLMEEFDRSSSNQKSDLFIISWHCTSSHQTWDPWRYPTSLNVW